MEKIIHQGNNVRRFREMLGIKQQTLADTLGGDWTQKKVSLLEHREELDAQTLEAVAKAMGIPNDAIKNFDEEKAIYNIQHNYEGSNAGASVSVLNYHYTFNPFDKIIELYEALLESERQKQSLLEKIFIHNK